MTEATITGASGIVGSHLASTLVEQGRTVKAIVRSDAAASIVAELGADPVVVDLFDHDGLRDALWGSPILFHVAGVNQACAKDPSSMDHVNIGGTRSVVEAAADAGVGRVVYTSSAAVIGEPQGTVGHEGTAHTGEFLSPYARSKYLAENAAFETAASTGVDLVAVNPSSVQGPGRSTGSARILIHALSKPKPWLVDTKVSIVDIRDCSAGHIAAAEHGRTGERYLLSGATISVKDAVELAQGIAGSVIEPRWISLSTLTTWGGMAAGVAHLLKPNSDICPALIRTLSHGHRFDASKSERDLGLRYTPISNTFQRTIDWFSEEGLI
ncbi:MAG: NAD-dependent epimerase/dehydratase family protein [Acidimicrobiia bacterium]